MGVYNQFDKIGMRSNLGQTIALLRRHCELQTAGGYSKCATWATIA
jgi:hypothetical protein